LDDFKKGQSRKGGQESDLKCRSLQAACKRSGLGRRRKGTLGKKLISPEKGYTEKRGCKERAKSGWLLQPNSGTCTPN